MKKQDSKKSIPPIVSICIPTFSESSYIIRTLAELEKQTVFEECEIVLGDYDPQSLRTTERTILSNSSCASLVRQGHLRIVNVPERGIGIGRHYAVTNSRGHYVVCFDADSRFATKEAIERLVSPIQQGKGLMTHCQVLLEPTEVRPGSLSNTVYSLRNFAAERIPYVPIVMEAGLTIPIDIYKAVGGFRQTAFNWAEGCLLALDVSLRYGYHQIKMVDDVTVITSTRRDRDLFLDLNYNMAYRDGKRLMIK